MYNLSDNYSIEKQRFTNLFGHLFFLALAILSFLFYKERMLYYDPAYFSFWIINENNFSIALGRWGAFFSQIFPLIGVSKHFSIEAILQLYSLNFILIYYLIFIIIQYLLKDVEAVLVLILALCLTFRTTFYYPTAELYHGIAFSILFWSFLKKILQYKGATLYSGLFICILMCVSLSYFHQLTVFLILFFLVLEILKAAKPHQFKLFLLFLFCLLWFFIRMKFLTVTDYEKGKMPGVSEVLNQLPALHHNPTLIKYIDFFYKESLIPLVAFIVSFFLLLRTQIRIALLSLISFIGFSLIIIITLHKGESIIMTENYFTVLGTFMALPIVLIIQNFRFVFFTSIFLILSIYSTSGIYLKAEPLTNRIEKLELMIDYGQQFHNKKYIIREDNFAADYYWSSWSMPFETMLLSSLSKKDETVTFFIQKQNLTLTDADLKTDNIFLGPEWSPLWLKSNSFNSNYFILPGGEYLSLSTIQDQLLFDESTFNRDNFKIEPLRKLYFEGDDVCIKLTNLSNQIIPSIPGSTLQLYISYHLKDEKSNLIAWDNIRTPINFDLHPNKSLSQFLKVNRPQQSGKYTLEIDVVAEGKRWWNINATTEIIF